MIRSVMQCDGCGELLSEGGQPITGDRWTLFYEALRKGWKRDGESKHYCRTCTRIAERKHLVPPAPPKPKREKPRDFMMR